MSRSLARIRNLVSEIEEIHRNGQRGSFPKEAEQIIPEPSKVSTLNEHREPPISPAMCTEEGKVYLRLKGAVALSLQIEDAGETVLVKQVGDLLEIRFADGKAFHLPLKPMA